MLCDISRSLGSDPRSLEGWFVFVGVGLRGRGFGFRGEGFRV